jgi:hypothetical protein
VNKSLKQLTVFNVGDRVWLEQPPVTTFISQDDHEKYKVKKAFRPRFSGPYEVVKKISPITYVLNVGGQFKHHTIDRMKAFKNRPSKIIRKRNIENTNSEDITIMSKKGMSQLIDDSVMPILESESLERYNTRSRSKASSVKSIMKRIRMIWLRNIVTDVKVKIDGVRHVNSEVLDTDNLLYSYTQSYLS